ncbi:hypothetical protein HanIR_Chr13g0654521 [Helianthus annuus]|nr:hypothetical protein HanIR_Chr13g0654521 [Helianthus annuus]
MVPVVSNICGSRWFRNTTITSCVFSVLLGSSLPQEANSSSSLKWQANSINSGEKL